MSKVTPIAGCYQKVGPKLISTGKDFVLYLLTRKGGNPSKPKDFILMKPVTGKTLPDGSRDRYVSSMYPTPHEGVFKIDYQGVVYYLNLGEPFSCIIQAHTPPEAPGWSSSHSISMGRTDDNRPHSPDNTDTTTHPETGEEGAEI